MRITLILLCLVSFIIPQQDLLAESPVQSTAEDRTGLSLTVYNQDLGLVKDARNVALKKGRGVLQFLDVAAEIIPSSVQVKGLPSGDSFTVLEQSFEYDLISPDKLLDKYVGKTIKIVVWNEYQDRKEIREAVLLSNNQGQVYRIDDQIYLGHPGYKVLPRIPQELVKQPTLSWLYDNEISGKNQLKVTYLTKNISWRADYVLTLNPEDSQGNLSGWATVDNRSGLDYPGARLTLVAGKPHQVKDKSRQGAALMRTMEAAGDANQFKEKPAFAYHSYDLQRQTTLKEKQTKQIVLLQDQRIDLDKEFIVSGQKNFFRRQTGGKPLQEEVQVFINFENSKQSGPGMPLPGGLVRLYQEEAGQGLLFIGEDRIEHASKGAEVRLLTGRAFDLAAERRQTDYKRISSKLHESAWEISLKNHKEQAVTISLIEPLTGNWELLQSSHSYEKRDAFTLGFQVEVPAGGEVTVSYRVRVGI